MRKMNKLKILLVEDERKLVNLVKLYLEREGFEVVTAQDGEQALNLFQQTRPALVILDLMLPLLDGWEVCRRIRQQSFVPMIMLTAKDEEGDKVLGLSLGADDYVTKPFSPRELVARVKAQLRRARYWTQEEEELGNEELKLNISRREVWVRGEEVQLTALEFDLLACLAKSPGRVFSRDQLLHQVWGANYYGDPRVVDVHIGNLRKKIELDPSTPLLIKTIRDVGYKLEDNA